MHNALADKKTARPRAQAFSANGRRGQRGAGLVNAVMGLWLMSVGVAASVLILFNLGMAVTYKQKVAYIAEAGAKYVTRSTEFLGARKPKIDDAMVQSQTTTTVNNILDAMNLPDAQSVSVERITLRGHDYVKVTVSVVGLTLRGGGVLPSVISVSETGYARCEAPPAVLGGTFPTDPNFGGIYLPAYGAGSNTAGPVTYPVTKDAMAYYGISASPASSGPYSKHMGNQGPWTPFPQ